MKRPKQTSYPKPERAKNWEYLDNCYLKGHQIWNLEEEKCINLHCGRYACRLHGWKKKLKLQKGLKKFLSNFKQIRFWTFTASSKYYDNIGDHAKMMSKAWRYFTTFVRRHKSLTESEQDFQYVKVVDLHISGYIHYHAFFDRFISVYKLRDLWNQALILASGYEDMRGTVWAKTLLDNAKAANYITKYVVKAAQNLRVRINYYSKSSRVSLFEKFESKGRWIHTHAKYTIFDYFNSYRALLVNKIAIVTDKIPQIVQISLFPI